MNMFVHFVLILLKSSTLHVFKIDSLLGKMTAQHFYHVMARDNHSARRVVSSASHSLPYTTSSFLRSPMGSTELEGDHKDSSSGVSSLQIPIQREGTNTSHQSVELEGEHASEPESRPDEKQHGVRFGGSSPSTSLSSDVSEADEEPDVDWEAEDEGPLTTPVECKFRGDPTRYTKGETKGSVVGHAKIAEIVNFHDSYFREVQVGDIKLIEEDWNVFVDVMKICNAEVAMYKHLARVLTRICVDLCKSSASLSLC